jgi:uncharacterized protein GlcG (DUF336 family)
MRQTTEAFCGRYNALSIPRIPLPLEYADEVTMAKALEGRAELWRKSSSGWALPSKHPSGNTSGFLQQPSTMRGHKACGYRRPPIAHCSWFVWQSSTGLSTGNTLKLVKEDLMIGWGSVRKLAFAAAVTILVVAVVDRMTLKSVTASGGNDNTCRNLPGYDALKSALDSAVSTETSGLNLHMWATLVDRDGVVCVVAFSGVDRGAQWPGSRAISAQKANTANAFSLDQSSSSAGSGIASGLALSTANLFSAVQPGGSLFGLQESNPVDTNVAYQGPSSNYGKANDPMVGQKVGGVNVFGGGLGLYSTGNKLVGGLGVSGDTSCTDHFIGWRVRNNLGLDHLLGVGGVSGDPNRPDNIIFDITPNPTGGTGISAGGFGHPTCINTGNPATLPAVQP